MSHARLALAIVLLFLLHTPVFTQLSVALDKNDPELRSVLTEIEADAEKARVKAKIPGMSIVIVYDQDVLLAKGFGYADLEKKIPADRQTVYRIGSVTKAFTALMLMQLRGAGKLNLEDPIEKYLPEFMLNRGSPTPGRRHSVRLPRIIPAFRGKRRCFTSIKSRTSFLQLKIS